MLKINDRKTDVLDFLIKSVKYLLEIDHVTENDDFFTLGGDSLTAIDLIALIQKQYQIKLELIVLFENRTLVDLSNAIIKKTSNNIERAN